MFEGNVIPVCGPEGQTVLDVSTPVGDYRLEFGDLSWEWTVTEDMVSDSLGLYATGFAADGGADTTLYQNEVIVQEGYAPDPCELPFTGPDPILGIGVLLVGLGTLLVSWVKSHQIAEDAPDGAELSDE